MEVIIDTTLGHDLSLENVVVSCGHNMMIVSEPSLVDQQITVSVKHKYQVWIRMDICHIIKEDKTNVRTLCSYTI
jgi:hypothetical protein